VDEHHVRELYRAVATLDESAMDDLLFGVALGERGMAVLLDEALGVFDSVS
jgi:CelD/BcsL family acetyltransferase involved in cellulose biosynthesis